MPKFQINGKQELEKVIGKADTIKVPDGVRRILRGAFDDRSCSTRKIVLPDSVERIDRYSVGIGDVEELELGEDSSLRWISNHAFSGRGRIRCLKLPKTIEHIGYRAFLYGGPDTVIFPEGADTDRLDIGLQAFNPVASLPWIIWPYGPEADKAGLQECFTAYDWSNVVALVADNLDPYHVTYQMRFAIMRGAVRRVKNGEIPPAKYRDKYLTLLDQFIFREGSFTLRSDGIPWLAERDCARCMARWAGPELPVETSDRLLRLFTIREDAEICAEILSAREGHPAPPDLSLD